MTYPLPSIHLNGTGLSTLEAEYDDAYQAARKARAALAATTCNGRDFYPPGDAAYSKARDERDRQLKALDNVIAYIAMHLEHFADQAALRSSR
jgi:hypothetical protein